MPFLVGFGQNSICSQRGGLATGMTNKEVSKLYKDCKRVESVDVEVVPFGELMLRHGIEHVDALFIDMEGYELAALESIDFSRISVTALCVENNEDPRDAGKVRRLLEPLGYRLAATLAQDDIYVSSKVAVS